MKVLFAVSNEEISESIVKKYQRDYKEIISYKNVYYFNAILKELQKDKSYDRVVISEELETFTNTQYDQVDKIIFEKLDSISDEASNTRGNDIPIILICSDRRTKTDGLLVKLFGISIYDALIGNDRSIDQVCNLIHKPRSKKEAKTYYQIDSDDVSYQSENENDVSEMEIQNIVAHYKRLGKNEEKFIESFNNIAAQYNDNQLRIITKFLPLNVRAVLEEKSPKYQQVMSFNNAVSDVLRNTDSQNGDGLSGKLLTPNVREKITNEPIVIPTNINSEGVKKLSRHNRNISEPVVNNNQVIDNSQNANYNGLAIQQNAQNNQPINKYQFDSQIINQQANNQQANNQQISNQPQIVNNNYVQKELPDDSIFEADPIDPFSEIEKINSNDNEMFENNQEYNMAQDYNEIQTNDYMMNAQEEQNQTIEPLEKIENTVLEETPVVNPVKRGRGRPRKNPIPDTSEVPKVKRGRGRPRKNPIPEENISNQISNIEETSTLPGFELEDLETINEQTNDSTYLPGFEDDLFSDIQSETENDIGEINNSQKYLEEDPFSDVLEETKNDYTNQDYNNMQVQNDYTNQDYNNMQVQNDYTNQDYNNMQVQNDYTNQDYNNMQVQNDYTNQSYDGMQAQNTYGQQNNSFVQMAGQGYNNYNADQYNDQYNNQYVAQNTDQYNNQYTQNTYQYESTIDLSSLLTPDKKIVTFVGTSKNGTSFIINNIAEYISSNMGINTAILDATKNRNSYYIYTKNEEQLRNIAKNSIEGLAQGVAQGINVNRNLTVYTSLPDDNESIQNVDKILETLLQKHSLVLIDTDFNTSEGYFKQSQETYLVQTYDILTIQPLTELLNSLKSKNI